MNNTGSGTVMELPASSHPIDLHEFPGAEAVRMAETEYRASRCCRVLGNPIAYRILRVLGERRMTPGEIAREIGRSPMVVSRTLRHLRQIDLVRHDAVGGRREYWLKRTETLLWLDALEGMVCALRVQRW